jgi:hypothetical protein
MFLYAVLRRQLKSPLRFCCVRARYTSIIRMCWITEQEVRQQNNKSEMKAPMVRIYCTAQSLWYLQRWFLSYDELKW